MWQEKASSKSILRRNPGNLDQSINRLAHLLNARISRRAVSTRTSCHLSRLNNYQFGCRSVEYFLYLKRDFDKGGFDFRLGQVNRFSIRDVFIQHAMVCLFIMSIEYQLRFGSVVRRSNDKCRK